MLYIVTMVLVGFCSSLLASPLPDPSYVPETNNSIANAVVDLDIKQTNTEIENDNSNIDEILDVKSTTPVIITDDADEDMETADMMVFRPLFVYRKRTAQKQRVQNGNRRNDKPQYYQPQYVYY